MGRHGSSGSAPGGSPGASAHCAAANAGAGPNSRPAAPLAGAPGPGPTAPPPTPALVRTPRRAPRDVAQASPPLINRLVARIDRQQSTERHHGHEHNPCFRHHLRTLHPLHGCILFDHFFVFFSLTGDATGQRVTCSAFTGTTNVNVRIQRAAGQEYQEHEACECEVSG